MIHTKLAAAIPFFFPASACERVPEDKTPVIEAESDIFVKPMKVKIASSSPALEVRYTLDGTEPGVGSRPYKEPIVVATTTTVRARAFHDGKPVSGIVTAEFTKVEPTPGRSREPHAFEEGATCWRWAGDWNDLKRVGGIDAVPTEIGPVGRVELSDGRASAVNRIAEHVALVFEGSIQVEEPDVYRFELTSDDGSMLWIDGKLLIDNDGLHSSVSKDSRRALGPGMHDIKVGWFNKAGDAQLSLKSGPLGAPLAPVRVYRRPESLEHR